MGYENKSPKASFHCLCVNIMGKRSVTPAGEHLYAYGNCLVISGAVKHLQISFFISFLLQLPFQFKFLLTKSNLQYFLEIRSSSVGISLLIYSTRILFFPHPQSNKLEDQNIMTIVNSEALNPLVERNHIILMHLDCDLLLLRSLTGYRLVVCSGLPPSRVSNIKNYDRVYCLD